MHCAGAKNRLTSFSMSASPTKIKVFNPKHWVRKSEAIPPPLRLQDADKMPASAGSFESLKTRK